jgi:hypothetical protein
VSAQDYESALRLTTSPSSTESPASVAASIPANLGANYNNLALGINSGSIFGFEEDMNLAGNTLHPLMLEGSTTMPSEALLSLDQTGQPQSLPNMMHPPFVSTDHNAYQLEQQAIQQQQEQLHAHMLQHHASNSSMHTADTNSTAPSNLYLADPAMHLASDLMHATQSEISDDMLSPSFQENGFSNISSGFVMPGHPLHRFHHERANSMIVNGVDMHPSHLLLDQYKQAGLDEFDEGVIVEDEDEEEDDLNGLLGTGGFDGGSALFAGVPHILDSAFALTNDFGHTDHATPDADIDGDLTASTSPLATVSSEQTPFDTEEHKDAPQS